MSEEIDPFGSVCREKQMSINFDFLLKCIDGAHAALSKRTNTWQERAREVPVRAAAARDALKVIIRTPAIRAWLLENDPKALRQCEEVFE